MLVVVCFKTAKRRRRIGRKDDHPHSFLLKYTRLLLFSYVVVSTNPLSATKGSCYCRYHYNVMDSRLHQHVDKGREDGLYISCVASSVNMWAIVMDAGTGFSSQVYELSSTFLHKVGILETPPNQPCLFPMEFHV